MNKSNSVKLIDDLAHDYKKLCECRDVNDLIETANHILHHIFLSYSSDNLNRYVQGYATNYTRFFNPKVESEDLYYKFYQITYMYISSNIDLVYHIRNKILSIAGNDLEFYIKSLYNSIDEDVYLRCKHLLWMLGCDDGYTFYTSKRNSEPLLKVNTYNGNLELIDSYNRDLDTIVMDRISQNLRFTEKLFFHKFIFFGNFKNNNNPIFRKVELVNTIYRYNDFYRPLYKLYFRRNKSILKYYDHDTKNSLMLF